jgi:hypothetical protein
MAYAMDWKKILIISALLLAPLALTNCGSSSENNSASSKVGPSGPTYPNKLYFDLTTEATVVRDGDIVSITVRVWDAVGNMAGNVSVYFSGGGSWVLPTTPAPVVVTDSAGIAHGMVSMKGGAGTLVYVTATVENMSLTIPVQIIATGGAAPK